MRAVETFDMAAESYITAQAQGGRTPRAPTSGAPSSQPMPARASAENVADIDTDDLLAILQPIWTTKNVTATRVRPAFESSWTRPRRGLRSGQNPARWKGHLALMLAAPARVHKATHHAALPVADMPKMMAKLARMDGIAPLALRFLALTVGRATEIVGASLSEVDESSAAWTIRASRMDTGAGGRMLTRDDLHATRGSAPWPWRPTTSSPSRS